jgi:long-subunit acyl-CoA synthetase (AMP-forming)
MDSSLLTLILGLFQNNLSDKTAVISKGSNYSLKDIFIQSIELMKVLNRKKKAKIDGGVLKVGLIASNSKEWIVVFIATILSRNKLVLFSPCLSEQKIAHVIVLSRIDILITDAELSMEILEVIDFIEIVRIDTLHTSLKDVCYVFTNSLSDEERVIDTLLENIASTITSDGSASITVYSPRQLQGIEVLYTDIVETLSDLTEKGIFESNGDKKYIAFVDFTYNYVVGLLLPLITNHILIIPEKDNDFTENEIDWLLFENKPEVVILTAHQFEKLWRYSLEPSTNEFLKLLSDFRIKWLKKIIVKRNIRKLFPNLKKLIILNSSISTMLEMTLKEYKVPFTITYGTIETCGIASYSDPKNFKVGSVGKMLKTSRKNLIERIIPKKENDNIFCNNEDTLYFISRMEENIVSNEGKIITRDVEKIFKSLPLVIDCVLVQDKEDLYLLVTIDTQYCDIYGITHKRAKQMLNACKDEINTTFNSIETITRIVISLTEFKRDSYGRIMKEYYTLD